MKLQYLHKSAEFSQCGKYRYQLTRVWDESKPVAMCIGLNPSNANAEKDDPTIRILTGCLNHLGYGSLKMMNLYAIISPIPKKIFEVPDAQGHNDAWLTTTAYGVQEIIFCWGGFKNIEHRAKQMIKMFPDAKCFGKTASGMPNHPRAMSYIKGFTVDQAKLDRFV